MGRAVENGNRDRRERCRATAANRAAGRGCRHPSARRSARAESAGAAPAGCRRCRSTAEPASISLTRMRRSAAATRRACSRRSANGAMPATGFSGFCGDTSHQTSSSSRRSSASRLICRWPPWAGLNEPPEQPDAAMPAGARAGALGSAAFRGAPGRCRARGICRSSARRRRPGRAAAAAGSRCRSRRPCRTRRHRRTGSRR